MKTTDYSEVLLEIAGLPVKVAEYRIGGVYHCHVSNVDPGATISRASAASRNAAREEAIRKVQKKISPNTKNVFPS